MRENLTKKEIIRSRAEFSGVFNNSASVGCRGAKMLFKKNDLGYCRFGVTLRRHFGNSVQRNYARRVLKELFRTSKSCFKDSFDIVIILYPGDDSYRQRQEQYKKLLKRADIAEIFE